VSSGAKHPLEVKKELAIRIVSDFHGSLQAGIAQADFEAQFQNRALPSDIRTHVFSDDTPRTLFRLLTEVSLCPSNTVAQRKIKEGAVYLSLGGLGEANWQRLTDPTWWFYPRRYPVAYLRVGRRLLRVEFNS